jgi:predicted enzyme related to lactoylglutathione lyase
VASGESIVKIKLSSIIVDDQSKALKFYTEVLGFVKKTDIPIGEDRWLTVVSPEAPDEVELVLEPNSNPAARTFQQALHEQGIPLTAFVVEDINKEYERLKNLGVVFHTPPTNAGPATIAIFDDTCGNLIQIYQV